MSAVASVSVPKSMRAYFGEKEAESIYAEFTNAHATLANHPNDANRQREAAQSLYGALNKISKNNELRNESAHPHFKAAMDALQKGNLKDGLTELSNER